MLDLYRLLLKDWVKLYSERHWRCPRQKIMRSSAESIVIIMQRERMSDTGAYDTVESTTSSMDDTYSHVPEYK